MYWHERTNRTEAETTDLMEIGGSPVSGVTLQHVLKGHIAPIGRIAWSPDGSFLATPSGDKTIRIWDMARGACSTVLEGHEDQVHSVTWSPDGQKLASGSADKTIRIWDIASGNAEHLLKEHSELIRTVSWSRDGQMLASGSEDHTIQVWDLQKSKQIWSFKLSNNVTMLEWSPNGRVLAVASDDSTISLWNVDGWKPLHLLKGHSSYVISLAWSPDGLLLASASADKSIRVWHAKTGEQYLILEEHLESIRSLSFSHDGFLLASKSLDNTIRMWATSDWQVKTSFAETNLVMNWHASLSFHPHLPILATLGENDTVIRIWDIDMDVLLGNQPTTESVRYTTAKVVLVGDSGVGKTGLGWRLAHGEFKEHASTHGQQFWVLDDLKTRRKDGTECEAVLWDLAGQHVYRSVHAIFLDDVDASLVLFDPTNRQEPLKGAQFWLEQLASKKQLPPTVLVGARVDRGAPMLSQQDFEQFCQRYGISGGYLSTSAKEGHGLQELLEILKRQIPWDQMTATVTTLTFKRIKEHVLALKEKPDRRGVLVRPAELRPQLQATDPEWQFSDAEMMTAVKHLSNHGYVAVLHSSAGEEVILLAPELLVDLAASIVLQADKHPRELGALRETLLLQGGYPFAELAALATGEGQILLDAAVGRFLSHNICFREILGTEALLIFPSLIKQKRPLLEDLETLDDVSYVARGRTENVYAALVVLLGYTQTFTRINQWQSQAQYELGSGEICGFRLIEEREGEIELVLYYSAAMPTYGRSLFQGLFEKFLYQRDVDVTRFPPVVCPNGHRQERATVVKRIREGKAFLFCEECGDKIALPEIEKPLTFGIGDTNWIQREEALARLRSAYETQLVRVKGFRRDRQAPRSYLSYVAEQAEWAAQLAQDLREAGVFIVDDRAQLQPDDFVIMISTPAYKLAWNRPNDPISSDAALIRLRFKQTTTQPSTVIPLVLEDDSGTVRKRERQLGDFRAGTYYAVSLFDLVLNLYAIPLNHPAFKQLREALDERWERTLAGHTETGQAEDQHQVHKLLDAKRQRLNVLETQAASYGLECPAHITVEIENLRKEIQNLVE
jgi:small GTP-binding protein